MNVKQDFLRFILNSEYKDWEVILDDGCYGNRPEIYALLSIIEERDNVIKELTKRIEKLEYSQQIQLDISY